MTGEQAEGAIAPIRIAVVAARIPALFFSRQVFEESRQRRRPVTPRMASLTLERRWHNSGNTHAFEGKNESAGGRGREGRRYQISVPISSRSDQINLDHIHLIPILC